MKDLAMDRLSNRSPSPLTTRKNPNSRNSESNSNIRRSFNGSPFGARSSDFTNPRFPNPIGSTDQRRHSLGKEGSGVNQRAHDEKENEKAARLRSPAKGSKNFMSPTISAASKFTPTPRKKVLAERNEIVRTSIQLSDFQSPVVMEDSCVKSDNVLDQIVTEGSFELNVDQKEVIVEVPSVPKVTLESDSDFVSNTRKRVSFSDESTIIAPLDAPSVPQVTLDSEMNKNADFVCSTKKKVSFSDESTIIAPLETPSVPQVTLDSDMNKNSDCVCITQKKVTFSDNSPIIAPLDADPSQPPPYDPKTNFLSPRPQFLHYRPNPRIEVFLNKEKEDDFGECGGMKLEDSFILSEEESQVEDSPEDSEDLSSTDIISEGEDEPIISEPIPISTPSPEPTFEAKRTPKPRFFTRAVTFSLLLMVFLIACVSLSVPDSPAVDLSMLQNVNFSKFYDSSEMAAFAKSNVYELARNFRQWSANSISYLYALVFTQSNELNDIQFVNLTFIPPQDDLVFDQHIGVYIGDDGSEETWEEGELETVGEEQDEDEDEEEVENATIAEDHTDLGSQGTETLVAEEELPEFESEQEVSEVSPELVAADLASSNAGIDLRVEDTKVEELSAETEVTPSEPLQSTVAEIENISSEPLQSTVAEIENISSEPLQSTVAEIEDASSEPLQSTVAEIENASSEPLQSIVEEVTEVEVISSTADALFSTQSILGASLLLFSLAASTVFIYLRQRKSGASSIAIEEPVAMKQEDSQKWEEEAEVVAESCPSEMSSFQKSSSYTKRVVRERERDTNEAQSQEKRPRTNYKRESLASSSSEFSMGSLSYGSFTTYERIPIKKASGEEEIVTPVRRSSRIRSSHITSP